jgi:hypothetical protein
MLNHRAADALSRRSFFSTMGQGLAGVALADLLHADSPDPESGHPEPPGQKIRHDVTAKLPHFEPRADAVIQLFMHGGPSQMDTLDPKPLLDKYDGKNFPGVIDVQQPEEAGGVLKSPFKFARYGESGTEVSELLPHLAECVDDITVIRSMYTEHINHEPALHMIHTGLTLPGRPTIGSWVVYGLGSVSQNLPAYVVLDDPKGMPVNGISNWSAGWLPPVYQGTRFRASGTPVWNLDPHRKIKPKVEQARRELLSALDKAHRENRPGEPELDARISSYELAARMQISSSAALDLSSESVATQRMYGLDDKTTESYGRRCLMARRLVERGVRYVQLFIPGQIWDHHTGLERRMRSSCAMTDKPIGGLLKDLSQRGLLDRTLVVWGGEFGRLPISQAEDGRDHNRQGFTMWMAGGGVKRGAVYGASDDFGYAAVQDRVSVPDLHATILHLLGMNHHNLVFRRNGLDERLTGVHEPRVVKELFA